MTRQLSIILFLLSARSLTGQVGSGLVTWLTFDKPLCEVSDEYGDPGVQVFTNGGSCRCGVAGSGLRLNGDGEWFSLYGERIDDVFKTIDFSLSFYMKPLSSPTTIGVQSLFSKQFDCLPSSAFVVQYKPSSQLLSVELLEAGTVNNSLSAKLPANSCWHHVVIVRREGTTTLYINKEEVASATAAGNRRVNISNSELLLVGSSGCAEVDDFDGLIDEIRLYNRAISRNDIQDLYLFPDQISTGLRFTGTNDTTIYLGNAVRLGVRNTCAAEYAWSPASGLDDPNLPDPLASPVTSTEYIVVLRDSLSNCAARDTIRIQVVDPATVDCSDILLPTAFTPNGDGLNDRFGISNPFAAGEILVFQVFDRWGNIVFETRDPLDRWDGRYKGQDVNPGTYLYRIRFRCQGEEGVISGEVTLIR